MFKNFKKTKIDIFIKMLISIIILASLIFSCALDTGSTNHKSKKNKKKSNNSSQTAKVTFDEFIKNSGLIKKDNIYIYEGDIKISEKMVMDVYNKYLKNEINLDTQKANIAGENGKLWVWDSNTASNLTYKFTTSMATNVLTDEQARNAFREATYVWMAVANVKFIEKPTDTSTVFTVHTFYEDSTTFMDSSLPGYDNAEIRYNLKYPNQSYNYVKCVFVHELGHMLGLAHEHERSDAPYHYPEYGGEIWGYAYGPYDPDSVMHYDNNPYPNGLSTGDRAVMVFLYGIPINKLLAGDFNGDGKSDIFHLMKNNNGYIYYANPDGISFSSAVHVLNGADLANINILISDVNGDGKSDIVYIYPDGTNARAQVKLSNGNGFTDGANNLFGAWGDNRKYLPMDVNGDGKSDIVYIYPAGTDARAQVKLSNGNGFTDGANNLFGAWGDNRKYLPMDVNDDGKSDIVYIYPAGTDARAQVKLSDGNGFTDGANNLFGAWGDNRKYLPMDVNGDGKSDIVYIYPAGTDARAQVKLSNGNGFTDGTNNLFGAWGDNRKYLPMDVNGDGKSDIVYIYPTITETVARMQVELSNGNGFIDGANNLF